MSVLEKKALRKEALNKEVLKKGALNKKALKKGGLDKGALSKRALNKKVPAAVCICLAMVCICTGLCLYRRGNDFLLNLTIQAEGNGFSGQWLQSVLSQENAEADSAEQGISFAAWTEYKQESVSDESGARHCNTEVIAVCGESRCLLSFGKNLTAWDTEGCIIGKELAEELFGSRLAEGRELVWQGSRWTVRGVVEEPGDFVMIQVSKKAGEMTFNRISLALDGKENKRLAGEQLISRYGLAAHVLRFDYLYGIAWLKEMVPGKWSDFDGWKRNVKEYGRAVKLAGNAEKTSIEAAGLDRQEKGRWCILGSIFFCIAGTVLVHRKGR